MTYWTQKFAKYARMGPYGLAATAIIMLSVIFRIILVLFHFPTMNSDEGKMGLAGMHIAFQGQFVIYDYGQPYLGVLEAYLSAPFMRLFGVSDITLRMGMLLMFALFMIIMYWLASLLYSKRLALVTLILLSFGTTDMLIEQLRAIGGAMELIMLGALMLLLAYRLAATAGERGRGRYFMYFAWGWAAGLALWVHILVLPFVVCSGLLILVFCYREWRTRSALWILAGLLVGGFLLIPGYESIWHAFVMQSGATVLSGATPAQLAHLPIEQIVSVFLWGIPLASWFQPICNYTDLPYLNGPNSSLNPSGSLTLQCSIVQGTWSAGYLLLLITGLALAGGACWRIWRQRRAQGQDLAPEKQQEAVKQFARLMLLSIAVLVIFLYLRSPLSGFKPVSTRYLVGLMTITPAIIWPLWRLTGLENLRLTLSGTTRWLSRAATVLVLLATLGMTVWTVTNVPAAYAKAQQEQKLITDLTKMHITRLYLEYWTCYRLMYQSQENILCARPHYPPEVIGADAYEPDADIVNHTPNVPFMFPTDTLLMSPTDILFAKREITDFEQYNQAHGLHFREIHLDGMALFIPATSG